MTTPSHVPPVQVPANAPAAQVDPEIVATAKRLSGIKTRSAQFGRNVLKPAALGAVGGLVVVLANRKKNTETETTDYDTVTDTNE